MFQLSVFVAFALGAAESTSLPPELENLPALLGDENRLVDAVREFDLYEQALAEWDAAMAQELLLAGDSKLAQEKQRKSHERFVLVRKAYEYALQHYRANARATNYYAEILYDRFGEVSRALQLWRAALTLDPELSAPYNNLGIHSFHAGDYRQGLQYSLAALKLDPNNPDYLYNLAQCYLVHGPQVQEIRGWTARQVYDEAMALSKRAVENAPQDFEMLRDYALNFFVAENFGATADWTAAAKAWQQTRELARKDDAIAYTWVYEARAWIRKGNNKEAQRCLREALAIEPSSEVVKELLAKINQAAAAAAP